MKITVGWINSRLEIAEEKTTELEDTAIVIIHNETHRGKDQKKVVGQVKEPKVHIIRGQQREIEKKKKHVKK